MATPSKPITFLGLVIGPVEFPWPHWPMELFPQAYTSLSAKKIHMWKKMKGKSNYSSLLHIISRETFQFYAFWKKDYSVFILCICALHLTQGAHTRTHREHTPGAVGSQCCGAREQLGVRCLALAQGHLVVILKLERALYIHSPHRKSLPDWDSNSQPSKFQLWLSTIRPRLTQASP